MFLDDLGLSFFEGQGVPEVRPLLTPVEVGAEGPIEIVRFSRDELSDRDGQPLCSVPTAARAPTGSESLDAVSAASAGEGQQAYGTNGQPLASCGPQHGRT